MDMSGRGGRGRDNRRWRQGKEGRGLAWQRKSTYPGER